MIAENSVTLTHGTRLGAYELLSAIGAGRMGEAWRRSSVRRRFLNRCDYLDPALAWTGVKDSGRDAPSPSWDTAR
jgi:hypothetical protein